MNAVSTRALEFGDDLPVWLRLLVLMLLAAYGLRAMAMARHASRMKLWLSVAQLMAGVTMVLALLRPVRVSARTTSVGARVAVLVDDSRRMQVGSRGSTRAQLALKAVDDLEAHFKTTRVSFFEFGRGALRKKSSAEPASTRVDSAEAAGLSDLTSALEQLEAELGEKPSSIVVVSDGRFARPSADADIAAFRVPNALQGTPVHAVDVGGAALRDVSIVAVQTSGNAVAHQPSKLDVVVGCFGGINCPRLPLVVREHRKGGPPRIVASGEAEWQSGELTHVSFGVTIERAGNRVLEIGIESPPGDEVPENDVRFVTLQVTRERLRLLHVAGRPTFDVRAMRQWLKSDSSVDLVSFFILRTDDDDTNTTEDSELALIPFPVDELFDEHLPSFDAVVLADIDAERYRVSRYLTNLARYVEAGGGLILVGGPAAFSGGGYADSPLEPVLPVTLARSGRPFDTLEFVPRATEAGSTTAILAPLRALVGGELPAMTGANSLGAARDGAVVLWEHPSRNVLPIGTGSIAGAMPVLAVREAGDGRVVALAVDGTHRLAFGPDAVRTAGRAYGALWDGLLGWAIRDPRFESTHGEIVGECLAGVSAHARVTLPGRLSGELALEIERMDSPRAIVRRVTVQVRDQSNVDVELGVLDVGAYSAAIRLKNEPETRLDFACEAGGQSIADTRPDPVRLRRLAEANSGKSVDLAGIDSLPVPPATEVRGARRARPVLDNWIWCLFAAGFCASHWILRRMAGMA